MKDEIREMKKFNIENPSRLEYINAKWRLFL